MIKVKSDGNLLPSVNSIIKPNNFPTSSKSLHRILHFNLYKKTPRVVNSALGRTPNPGGNSSKDDSYQERNTCLVPKKHEKNLEHSDLYQSKKKKNKKSELEDNSTGQKKQTIKGIEVDFNYELDKNGNLTLLIPMKDGNTRRIEFDQILEKWYHKYLFPSISLSDGFNNKEMRAKNYSNRLDYLRKNIPDRSVIELQNEIGKSLSYPKIISATKFLKKYTIEEMVDINIQSGLVNFTDYAINKHRTIIKMSSERIQKSRKENFYLFPNK